MRYHAGVVTEADKLTGLEAGTVLRGRYRLLQSTSAGGGTVRAFDRVRQQNVALRLYGPTVDPDVRARVRARAAGAIEVVSPAVAPLFSFDEQGDWALAVRAWVDGEPLAGTLARRGPLAPRAFLRLVTALLDALAALDAAGQPHGAISPRNVILTGGDGGEWTEAVLVDAGMAVSALPEATRQTDFAQLGMLLTLGLGLGERFDPRAARLQLRTGADVVDQLDRLVNGRPTDFSTVEEARAALLGAAEAWLAGRVTQPAMPRPFESADEPTPPAERSKTPEAAATVDVAPPADLAPAVEAPAARREIRILGTPLGARVRWDSREAGVTPLVVVDRKGGSHTVEIELEGYLSQHFTIEADGDTTVHYALAPAPSDGGVAFQTRGVTLSPEEIAAFFPEQAPKRRPWWRRWQPWAVFGAGGAALIAGAILGVTPLQLLGLIAALGAAGAIIAG